MDCCYLLSAPVHTQHQHETSARSSARVQAWRQHCLLRCSAHSHSGSAAPPLPSLSQDLHRHVQDVHLPPNPARLHVQLRHDKGFLTMRISTYIESGLAVVRSWITWHRRVWGCRGCCPKILGHRHASTHQIFQIAFLPRGGCCCTTCAQWC